MTRLFVLLLLIICVCGQINPPKDPSKDDQKIKAKETAVGQTQPSAVTVGQHKGPQNKDNPLGASSATGKNERPICGPEGKPVCPTCKNQDPKNCPVCEVTCTPIPSPTPLPHESAGSQMSGALGGGMGMMGMGLMSSLMGGKQNIKTINIGDGKNKKQDKKIQAQQSKVQVPAVTSPSSPLTSSPPSSPHLSPPPTPTPTPNSPSPSHSSPTPSPSPTSNSPPPTSSPLSSSLPHTSAPPLTSSTSSPTSSPPPSSSTSSSTSPVIPPKNSPGPPQLQHGLRSPSSSPPTSQDQTTKGKSSPKKHRFRHSRR